MAGTCEESVVITSENPDITLEKGTICDSLDLKCGPKSENPLNRIRSIAKIKRRNYMRKYRYRLSQLPSSVASVSYGEVAKPIDKQSLNRIGSSKTMLVLRNMCDIKKTEKENADRIKTLSRRVLRRFGHLLSNGDINDIHKLLINISKQAEMIYRSSENVVEATQNILHHELITRQFILRGIFTRNKEPRASKIEELKKTFYRKMFQCNNIIASSAE